MVFNLILGYDPDKILSFGDISQINIEFIIIKLILINKPTRKIKNLNIGLLRFVQF